jgi:hypothetical protein
MALVILAQVQPVKAGTTGSGATVVVVVDGGTGPVNETTNVSKAEPISV